MKKLFLIVMIGSSWVMQCGQKPVDDKDYAQQRLCVWANQLAVDCKSTFLSGFDELDATCICNKAACRERIYAYVRRYSERFDQQWQQLLERDERLKASLAALTDEEQEQMKQEVTKQLVRFEASTLNGALMRSNVFQTRKTLGCDITQEQEECTSDVQLFDYTCGLAPDDTGNQRVRCENVEVLVPNVLQLIRLVLAHYMVLHFTSIQKLSKTYVTDVDNSNRVIEYLVAGYLQDFDHVYEWLLRNNVPLQKRSAELSQAEVACVKQYVRELAELALVTNIKNSVQVHSAAYQNKKNQEQGNPDIFDAKDVVCSVCRSASAG